MIPTWGERRFPFTDRDTELYRVRYTTEISDLPTSPRGTKEIQFFLPPPGDFGRPIGAVSCHTGREVQQTPRRYIFHMIPVVSAAATTGA